MKIPLTQGKFAIVDQEDFEYLNQWKWRYKSSGYAIRNNQMVKGRFLNPYIIYMHKLIMNNPKKEVDHVNHNKLDNRKSNLRIVTHAQNQKNLSLRKDNKSGYRGVSYAKQNNKWNAHIQHNNIGKNLGYFDTKEEAALAYNKASKLLHKHYGTQNTI